jgi:2-oxo-4-hydroxy-4-carboxy-5-ureidoimidazoline decarboxylase
VVNDREGNQSAPDDTSSRARFVATYQHLFEHSPWVVERAWLRRSSWEADALHSTFLAVIDSASEQERLALVRAHPELADKTAIAGGLTESSTAEQASAGLDRLSTDEYEAFHRLNRLYRERFGFPFIICVRLYDKASILASMRKRLNNDSVDELREAIVQIGFISKLRLADLSGGQT